MSLKNLVENVKQRITPDILIRLQEARKSSKAIAIGSFFTFIACIGVLNVISSWEIIFILTAIGSFILTWAAGMGNLNEKDAYKRVLDSDFDNIDFIPDYLKKQYKLLPEENQQLFNTPFSPAVLEYINKQVSAKGYLTYNDLLFINDQHTSENSVLTNRQQFIKENGFSTATQKQNLAVLDVNAQEHYKTFNSKATL